MKLKRRKTPHEATFMARTLTGVYLQKWDYRTTNTDAAAKCAEIAAALMLTFPELDMKAAAELVREALAHHRRAEIELDNMEAAGA